MKRFRARVAARAVARRNGGAPALPPLYAFTTFTFTPAGATGRFGPTLSAAVSAYTATAPWVTNTANFNMTTQGYQLWTVPQTKSYTITCAGAANASVSTNLFGYGAIVETTISLTQGEVIQLLVGQRGTKTTNDGGGGGGSFVASGSTPATGTCLVAAGGAGGGPYSALVAGYGDGIAENGASSTSGVTGATSGGIGGTNGSGGGEGGGAGAGGGGGFIGNGVSSGAIGGGQSFQNGGVGGSTLGGFGGGGSSYGSGGGRGGGGGGYSGGGAGNLTSVSVPFCAGGGGSFYPGGTFIGATNSGDGYITITAV